MSNHPFGLGVEGDDDNLEALLNSQHPKHAKDIEGKFTQLLQYVEEMHTTTRDNNSILHQLINTMEERINKKIDNLRTEMIELIQKNAAAGPVAVAPAPVYVPLPISPQKVATRRASAYEMRSASNPEPPIPVQKMEDIYDMVSIAPKPGFVIKTRKLMGDKNKVFINLFHHDLIALNPPGLAIEKAVDKPYMMMEEPTTTTDHAGVKCTTFNVGISSEYFMMPNPKVDINITAPVTIYKIIHKVNLKFNEFLDEGNYSIPRVATGYKGDNPPIFKVPQLKTATSAPTASVRNTPTPPPAASNNSSTNSMVAPAAAASNGNGNGSRPAGIASVWAATEPFDVPEGARHSPATPPIAPADNSHPAPVRRGSDNAMNDNDSVVSDITTNSNAGHTLHAKAPGARRSSLNVLMGLTSLGGGTASRNGSFTENNGATANGDKHAPRKIARKSVLVSPGSAGYNGGAIQGRNLLSGDMLEYVENENVDLEAAQALKNASVDDPAVLLGWQIWVTGSEEEENNTIYVVTDVRKNFLSKTEFRISRYRVDDAWVKLKRVEGKGGLDFRPMRKVLFNLSDEEETVA